MPESLKVLELGFGNGQFLSFCRSQGFSVTGVEINRVLVERAKAYGYSAFDNIEAAFAEGPFDLVAAFDVFEHLNLIELGELMDRMRRSLGEDGCLLIRVPNGDSPFGRRHQHGDLTHVSSFGEFKIRQMAKKWQLSVVAIGESPWYINELEPVTPKNVIRAVFKWAIELLFGFVFFRQYVCLDMNLVAVLRKERAQLGSTSGDVYAPITAKPGGAEPMTT